MSKVTITVSGPSGSGKSAIIQVLSAALGIAGIKIEPGLGPNVAIRNAASLGEALGTLRESTVVQIVEAHKRDGK